MDRCSCGGELVALPYASPYGGWMAICERCGRDVGVTAGRGEAEHGPDSTGEPSRRASLAMLLRSIEANDSKYDVRYRLVLMAVAAAAAAGYATGFRIDPSEPEWPVAYIELPTGQVSWHMPQHSSVWDGHSTADKYARIDEFCRQ